MKLRLTDEDADRLRTIAEREGKDPRELALEILRDAMKLREYAYESHVLDESQWRAGR